MNKKNLLIAVVVIVVVILGVYLAFGSAKKTIDVRPGQISKIETMAQLCAVDIYSEVSVLDTINDKVMFAVQKQKGSISFDVENMNIDADGDTVKITLSPEIVDLYESTDDNSWEVIDTKGLGFFTSDKLTNEEENALKENHKVKSKKLLYQNGTIKRARAEGAKNLKALMEKVYKKPVEVIDNTPDGAYYDEYK